MRRRGAGVFWVAGCAALLLVSLSLVTWRQSRAREALANLDRIQREISLVEAERADLDRRIEILESRRHVTLAAQERLGMHNPAANEIVLLAAGIPDEEDR
jgi:cell division protein FtsL